MSTGEDDRRVWAILSCLPDSARVSLGGEDALWTVRIEHRSLAEPIRATAADLAGAARRAAEEAVRVGLCPEPP